MSQHFQLGHMFFSQDCLGNTETFNCESSICSCPCHFMPPGNSMMMWFQSMLSISILHLAFAYVRSPWFEPAYATAQQQSRLHPQKETPT